MIYTFRQSCHAKHVNKHCLNIYFERHCLPLLTSYNEDGVHSVSLPNGAI